MKKGQQLYNKIPIKQAYQIENIEKEKGWRNIEGVYISILYFAFFIYFWGQLISSCKRLIQCVNLIWDLGSSYPEGSICKHEHGSKIDKYYC